jgi:hypothetical protein
VARGPDTGAGRARVLLPEISLATVYNTLNELVAMGEVREVQAGDGPRRAAPHSDREIASAKVRPAETPVPKAANEGADHREVGPRQGNRAEAEKRR